ncbi:MAG: ferrous iron transport protein B, partial [Candidatus Marinimicrobia bacterium]|nr:ferrous iron transport protein B [Candidatus Neomarinimicrobiota bacterium]
MDDQQGSRHGAIVTDSGRRTIALVGNPNVGKSVLFGQFTGNYVNVSNYPGTTVEITRGTMSAEKEPWEVIDTPGINNFIPSSEDEVVTRNILLRETPDRNVQVMDAKNLRRGLLLSLQLAEMGLPYTVSLNMSDEARDRGLIIDAAALSEALGVPVHATVATQKLGTEAVRKSALETSRQPRSIAIKYPRQLEAAAVDLVPLLPETAISRRALAFMLLAQGGQGAEDSSLIHWLDDQVDSASWEVIRSIMDRARRATPRSMNVEITRARMQAAAALASSVTTRQPSKLGAIGDWLGRMAIHPVGGLAVAGVVLVGMYYFVGIFGAGTLVDWLEKGLFGKVIIPALTTAVNTIVPWQWGIDLLVGEFGLLSMALSYSVAIVLPIVGTFFIAFGLLEDSGYLPRLSVMLNNTFKLMGLNGKAVLPMVLGLGCDTMATMTTRILDSKKERLVVTLLLALGVPCSAQLGVILGMLGGVSMGATVIWMGVVLGVLFMVGYLASKVLPGQSSDFLLEMPPLRRPALGNIIIKTLARLEWYIREAVPLFFLGTFILFLMDRLELLTLLEQVAEPVVQNFLGLPAAATAAFMMGFLRRDYGAAGLYVLARNGQMDGIQVLVSLVIITLFMPCI